ncbi:hypothetical protein [Conexibacter sp. SYSU D00693]|uniref:hypothetical protein n=1 Tax=Conexibacter sp. SYSU D00693 TaxID=2812560 RepID=UPI00196A734D|nr:hypothetical protein [Conexibacter sp. SYSU D00693]
MRRLTLLTGCAAALLLLACHAPAAPAAEPILPLDQVRAGMRCTALSVVRGTAISSFDAEVRDVLTGDVYTRDPRILVKLSGAAIEGTGVGPGFSGSPVYCTDGQGVVANIGAISETVGQFGGTLALVTPIERVLREPVDVPGQATAAPAQRRAAGRPVHPIAAPLAVSGFSGTVAEALRRAAAKHGRTVTVAPAVPHAAFPPQPLVPGAAMAVGIASGDFNAGAIGTVSFADAGRVWGFGHPLDGVGRRGLLLQDAYVYDVVGNPLATQDSATYKLAAAGNELGTLTNDALNAVVGRLGALPERFPLRIVAKDLDTGRVEVSQSSIADERALGEPSGESGLSAIAPAAVAQAASDLLRGTPTQQSGELCLRIEVRELKRPMRFCNRYHGGGGPGSGGAPMAADVAQAIGLLDSFRLGQLHVTKVEARIGLRRALRQAYLRSASAPARARRGQRIRVRVRARMVRGELVQRSFMLRVPRGLRRGEHELVLVGKPADESGDVEDLTQVLELSFGDEADEDGDGEPEDDPGPPTVEAVAAGVADIARYDGVTASFRGASRGVRIERAFRDPQLRLSGSARLRIVVR